MLPLGQYSNLVACTRGRTWLSPGFSGWYSRFYVPIFSWRSCCWRVNGCCYWNVSPSRDRRRIRRHRLLVVLVRVSLPQISCKVSHSQAIEFDLFSYAVYDNKRRATNSLSQGSVIDWKSKKRFVSHITEFSLFSNAWLAPNACVV